MIRSTRLSILLPVVAGLAFLSGCGSNRPDWEPSDPQEQVDLVDTGVTNATGTIEASSVKEVFASYEVSASPLGVMLSALAKTNFAGEKCVTKSSNEGTVDLACASDGAAKGTVNFSSNDDITASSTEIFIEFDTDNACVGSSCFQATFALSAKGSIGGLKTTLAASADAGDVHTFMGIESELSTEQATTKIALFDSGGRSYTFTLAVDGSFIIEGANGSFTCVPNGSGGHCTGSTEFDF